MHARNSNALLAIAVGLSWLTAPVHADTTPKPPAPHAQAPGATTPAAPTHAANPMDDFTGLTYTEDQKAAIRKVEDQTESRFETIRNDVKLNEDQKAALMRGYYRVEYSEIFALLNPEQQAEVRKKIAARHEQETKQKKQPAAQRARPNP